MTPQPARLDAVALAQAEERLRQERELFDQKKAQDQKSFQLRLATDGEQAVNRPIVTKKWQPEDWRKSIEAELAKRHPTARIDTTTPETCDRSAALCRSSVSSLVVASASFIRFPASVFGSV